MIVYNQVVYLPMELYYLCIDFVLQFIVEKYRNKLNQIKSNQNLEGAQQARAPPKIWSTMFIFILYFASECFKIRLR